MGNAITDFDRFCVSQKCCRCSCDPRDLYYYLLDLPFWWLISVLIFYFVAISAIFAIVFAFAPGGLFRNDLDLRTGTLLETYANAFFITLVRQNRWNQYRISRVSGFWGVSFVGLVILRLF